MNRKSVMKIPSSGDPCSNNAGTLPSVSATEGDKLLADDDIGRAVSLLKAVSAGLRSVKTEVIEALRPILEARAVHGYPEKGESTLTFTSADGTKRIILGTDVSRENPHRIQEGIELVKRYVDGVAGDPRSKCLTRRILPLLGRYTLGSYRISPVIQLRRLAQESGDRSFIEGVDIIERSFRFGEHRQFIRAEILAGDRWQPIPLNITEV